MVQNHNSADIITG